MRRLSKLSLRYLFSCHDAGLHVGDLQLHGTMWNAAALHCVEGMQVYLHCKCMRTWETAVSCMCLKGAAVA